MQVSKVCVKLIDDPDDKLLAFCTLTIADEIVIRDLKIIRGATGPFVAMPSRKLTDRCMSCGGKNHLRASYCNDCGRKLDPARAARDERGRAKLHTDIAHPINADSRSRLHERVILEYEAERKRSLEPGYQPQKLGADYDDDDAGAPNGAPVAWPRPARTPARAGEGLSAEREMGA